MSIGVGIAGWGAISEQLHGPCLAGMEECEIVAVCDEREERLAHAADEYRCKGYTDLDAFFDHPGLDLVVIPLPNFLHGPTAVRAQAAGKHVISEKPMSFSPEEAEHLVMMGREKGLVVTTHQNRRWDPNYVAVRRLWESGDLGKLHMIQSRHLGGPWQKTWADSSEWTGKGPFMSFGPHLLDQILSMSPDGPIKVSGILKSILNEDDYFNCFLTFSDDSTARVEMTKASRLKDYRRFEVSFEKGDVMVSGRSDPYTLHIQRDRVFHSPGCRRRGCDRGSSPRAPGISHSESAILQECVCGDSGRRGAHRQAGAEPAVCEGCRCDRAVGGARRDDCCGIKTQAFNAGDPSIRSLRLLLRRGERSAA